MSADRWSECPKCRVDLDVDSKRRAKKAADAYGKVSHDEYERLIADRDKPRKLATTLREDYEIGANEGELRISYHASCEKCGFAYSFKDARSMRGVEKS